MSPTMFLPLILVFLSATSFSTPSAFSDHNSISIDTYNLSAYQALQQYDFPVGLLPKGVTDYELKRDTGEFEVHFVDTCSFDLEGYHLRYKSVVSGVISKGKLKKLKGVSVKILFFWLNIVEVTRGDDELEFSVGIASASFAIDNFVESPQCGCGFDCVGDDQSSSLMSY